MFLVISPEPRAASVTLRAISLVVAFCSSTAVAMVLEISFTWLMIALICADRFHGFLGITLDGFDLAADVLGGLGGFLGQFLDLVGDHGKAFAGFSGARRFDGGVQGQQVGLLRDGGDDLDHLPISALDSPSLLTVALVLSATLHSASWRPWRLRWRSWRFP